MAVARAGRDRRRPRQRRRGRGPAGHAASASTLQTAPFEDEDTEEHNAARHVHPPPEMVIVRAPPIEHRLLWEPHRGTADATGNPAPRATGFSGGQLRRAAPAADLRDGHQFHFPKRRIVAGTSRARTRVASRVTASAAEGERLDQDDVSRHECWLTGTTMAAALVMMSPDAGGPRRRSRCCPRRSRMPP